MWNYSTRIFLQKPTGIVFLKKLIENSFTIKVHCKFGNFTSYFLEKANKNSYQLAKTPKTVT